MLAPRLEQHLREARVFGEPTVKCREGRLTMAIQRSEVQQNISRAANARVERSGSIDPSPFSRREAPSQRPAPGQIAEAAYYRALARGFEPGHEMDDWLAAERELEERFRE